MLKNIARVLRVSKRGDGFIENDKYIVSWAFGHLFSLADVKEKIVEFSKMLKLVYNNKLELKKVIEAFTV